MIRVVHPESGSWFFTHPGSRIQRSKRHRIPDPDPHTHIVTRKRCGLLQLTFQRGLLFKSLPLAESVIFQTDFTSCQGRIQGGCTGCTIARASPLPPCASPPGHVHSPPPQPERLVMRKDDAVGNKKKLQNCLPKHNYKLDNNFLTVEPRASVDPHCFDADPKQDLGGGGGRSAKNLHPSWQNPRYAPASCVLNFSAVSR